MNNFDRVNNSGINSKDMQLIKSYDAQIILNNDDKTLMQIGMKNFTVSVIKWKDSFYSEKPYKMAGLSGNGQLLPLYGVSDDVVHLKNLGEVKIILENIKDGKSINDKSWLEGIDRLYNKADEVEEECFAQMNYDEEYGEYPDAAYNEEVVKDKKDNNTARAKIEARKRNILKSRELRHEMQKRYPEEKVSGVVLADKIAADKISGVEERTITPETGLKIRRSKVRE